MRGAGVHLAPSGAAGMLIFHGVSLFTSIVKATERPSGDQLRFDGVSLTRVICDVAPSAFMIHRPESQRSSILFTQRRVYRIWAPSGDVCGSATCSQSR